MNSKWHSTRASLDDSSALFRASLGKLKAGQPVDIAKIIEQVKMTAESARVLRELVWSELPNASWQSRPELDALIDKIHENLAARALEQQRSRLSALASELERGTIVHRRAHRLQELSQLRDQAIGELRSRAGVEAAPPTLPGPEADRWISWACSLQEPQDTESLQALRNGFPHLDDFVANLEPSMWMAAESLTREVPPGPAERCADKVQVEPSEPEARKFTESVVSPAPRQVEMEAAEPLLKRHESRSPSLGVDQLSPPALQSNTLTPNDVTPPPTEEHVAKKMSQEHALLAGMMGLVTDPVGHFRSPVELPFTGELYREMSDASTASALKDPVNPFDQSVDHKADEEVLPKASAASAGADGETVTHFNGRVERPFTGKVFHETIIAPPGLVGDPIGYFDPPVERHFPMETFPEPSPASEIVYKIRFRLEQLWREKKTMVLGIAAVLVAVTLGAILWGSSENDTSAAPATVETKTAAATPNTSEDKGHVQPAVSAEPATQVSKTNVTPKEPPKTPDQSLAPKTPDQSAAAKPPAKTPPAKQASVHENEVLRPPAATRGTATTTNEKEEAPPNVAAAMPASIPGGLPSGGSNSVANIVKDVPVAVPRIGVEKVSLSSGLAQGLLIHQVTPQYPSQARQAHIQGTVVLQAVIGKDGAVQSLKVVSGHPMLNQAAMDAVRKWRYKPYRLNGDPVEADTQINVNFTLANQ